MDTDVSQKFKKIAKVYFEDSKFDLSIHALEKCLDINPNDESIYSMLADSYVAMNTNNLAISHYVKALSINPINTSNLLRLSALKLASHNYLDVLRVTHKKSEPNYYIEIGVCKGASFELANKDAVAIGIDPEPQLDTNLLPKKHIVISDTSDNYFESGRIEKDLDGEPFDMAFLDGMHLFEFALRDFINLEKHSSTKSVVFVHDLYPMNAETATRERNSDFWSGDVWKLVLCLQEYRPDLGLEVLPCPPTGLGYITKLDPHSTILIDNYDRILKKYIDMPFEVIEHDRERKLLLAGVDHPVLASV